MSTFSQTWILIRREFLERARSRAFQITMGVTVGLVILAVLVISLATNDSEATRIGLIGDIAESIELELEARADELNFDLETETFADRTAAEVALKNGDVRAVFTGSEILWWKGESNTVRAVVLGALVTTSFQDTAAALGLTDAELAAALAPPVIGETILNPPDDDQEQREIGAFVGLFMLYMAILIFGQFVALGVMEEKQNRVVEVVLSRVEPTQVLAAKVAGIGALGLLQLLVLGATILLALNLVDVGDISLPTIGLGILGNVIFWFILGYTMYAVIYAGLGATVSRQEDLQGAMILPLVVILPGFFIAQFTAQNPDGLVATIASFLPLWTPFVMPIRSALGSVALWEQALSVALVLAFSIVTVKISGRLYRGAVLQLGAKVRLRDAWRAVD